MAEKPPKIFKAPKLFVGEFSAELFQKKFLKRIYVREYREFLNKEFLKNAKGLYVLKPDLDKKEAATLKKIAKSIRQNTGFVLKGKLILVLVILGAVIVFNLLFKDALVERAAEAGLEGVFQARADINGLKFQPFRGRIYLDSLAVADAEKPFSNLFELGKTEVAVNMLEVLKGNVIIENIESREIKWDTRRSSSGALPGRKSVPPGAQKAGAEAPTQAAAPASDPFAFLGKAEGAAAGLLEREKANLKSSALLDELNKTYPALTDKWSAKSKDLSADLKKLAPTVDAVSAIKVDSINSPEDAKKAYDAIQSASSSVNSAKKDVDRAYSEFGKDLDKAKKDKKAVSEAIDGDFRHLKSFISPDSGGGSFVAPLIESILGKNIARIYTSARRGLSYAASLKPKSKGKAEEAPRNHARGFFVQFPGEKYPKFWLKNMGVSFGSENEDHTRGGIKDITSEPDLIGAPAKFDFKNAMGRQLLGISGFYDGRRGKDTVFDCGATLSNYSVTLTDGLQSLGIEKLECSSDAQIRVSIDDRNRTSGTIGIALRRIKITGSPAKNGISSKVIKALQAADVVSIQAGYSYSESGAVKMKIKTNLDKIIGDIVSAAVADMAKDTEKQLKKELDNLIGGKLGQYDSLYADLLKTDGSFLENNKGVGGYNKALDDKKKQVDERMAKLQKDATKKGAKELKKIKGKIGF